MSSLGKSCATTSMWKQFLLTLNYMLMSHHKCWIRNLKTDYVILDLYLINSHKDRRQSIYVFNLFHIGSFRNHELHKWYQHNVVI